MRPWQTIIHSQSLSPWAAACLACLFWGACGRWKMSMRLQSEISREVLYRIRIRTMSFPMSFPMSSQLMVKKLVICFTSPLHRNEFFPWPGKLPPPPSVPGALGLARSMVPSSVGGTCSAPVLLPLRLDWLNSTAWCRRSGCRWTAV